MSQFVGEGAALPHRAVRTRHTDEDRVSGGVPHREPVLLGADVEYCHVDPGGLFDD